mgnify:CR=1 FL=1
MTGFFLFDLTGQRFGRFTVLRFTGKKFWECRCDCGQIRLVKAGDLRNGKRVGCSECRNPSKVKRPDAAERKALQRVWWAMRDRCENPENQAYHNYGERGIFVCERWQDFEVFYRDMAPRPAGGTIDRIDNDGPYSPENCRWADRKTQCRNRRGNVLIEFEGETLTLEGWAERLDLPARRIWHRINRGRTPQEALAMGRGACRSRYKPRSALPVAKASFR